MAKLSGTLAQLNISPGGMPKLPIASAAVTAAGVEGDRQKNLKYHGGPDRAVCLFSTELYDALRTEGIDLASGSVGENFTIAGFDILALSIGDQLRVGECIIQITNIRVPCHNLDRWDKALHAWMKAGRTGWVAKVIQEGRVRQGDPIEVLGYGGG